MTEPLLLGALTVALLSEAAVIARIVISIVHPEYRIWPPGDVSWKFWYYWGGSLVTFGALTIVGYYDAGSFLFADRVWDWLGGGLALSGVAFAGWAGYTFRMRESFGLEGDLYTGGPYQCNRNPQYVGMYAALLGVLLLVNSTLLIVGMLPVFVWMALLPFSRSRGCTRRSARNTTRISAMCRDSSEYGRSRTCSTSVPARFGRAPDR